MQSYNSAVKLREWLFRNARTYDISFSILTLTDNAESPHFMSHLYEGDLKLTERQRLNNLLFGDPDGSPARAATNIDKIKWPNAVIPYEFDCSVGERYQVIYVRRFFLFFF